LLYDVKLLGAVILVLFRAKVFIILTLLYDPFEAT